jgi:hypothetical protein
MGGQSGNVNIVPTEQYCRKTRQQMNTIIPDVPYMNIQLLPKHVISMPHQATASYSHD